MDLKVYFKRLREVESSITEEFPLIISVETEDGGKCGRIVEVSRELAAKAIVEGRAKLVEEPETTKYRKREAEKKRLVEKAELARRLQIAVITDPEFRQLKAGSSNEKEEKEEVG